MDSNPKITESDSAYTNIEQMNVCDILAAINLEDQKIACIVNGALLQIEKLVDAVIDKINKGGRLIYIGAGTSGRLGVLDASECPPTFGVDEDMVKGIIAGGETALRRAVEFAEDDEDEAWQDLLNIGINENDFVLGLSASGSTKYVLNALKCCKEKQITTGSISCNPQSSLSRFSDFPIEVITGPEFITGSTRMKAGTAQKMILNMISTALMVKIGRIIDNKMVDMKLSNQKLVERGARIIMEKLNISDFELAKDLLLKHGSVRKAITVK